MTIPTDSKCRECVEQAKFGLAMCRECYRKMIDERYLQMWRDWEDEMPGNCGMCGHSVIQKNLEHHKGMWWCKTCWGNHLAYHAKLQC